MFKSTEISPLLVLTIASIATTFGVTGCRNTPPDTGTQAQQAQTGQPQDTAAQPVQSDQSPEPAATANLAPVATANDHQDQNYSNNDYDDSDGNPNDASYGQPVLQTQQPPPPLPEYAQPECPGDGYLWTPGYWSYSPQGYFWVPGAWA